MSESEKQQAIYEATRIRPDDSTWARILIGRARFDEARADGRDRRARNSTRFVQKRASRRVA